MRFATRWAVVGLLAGHLVSACQEEPPAGPADQLIDAWIEAAGGLDAWRAVDNIRYTVTTVWFDSTDTEVRRRPRYVWGKRDPLRARIERNEAEGHYTQAHDGEGNSWATLNGERLPSTAKAAAEVLYVGGDVMYWIGLPYKLRDPGVNLTYMSPDSTGNAGVRITFGEGVGDHPGDQYFYWFSDGSPFPIEVHYIEQGRTNVNRAIWSDNRRAGPLTYVGDRTFYNEEGNLTKQLLISDVEINPGVPDSLFLPPGG